VAEFMVCLLFGELRKQIITCQISWKNCSRVSIQPVF